MKKQILTENNAEQTPSGGVLVGKRQGQTIIHNKGTLSGYLVGKTHAEGGIKAVNKSTGQPLEMQGGEVVITAPAVSDQTKNEFNGKMMTNREILSQINVNGGGVAFAKDGMEIPKNVKRTGASYNYGGKTMTDHEIYKYITGGLIAPNGKSSNLTPEQYKLVRTPEFKEWFGDWEIKPDDNMLVDENGEPLILWHTGGNWTELDKSRDNGLMFAFTENTPAYSAKEKVTRQFFIKSDFIYLVKYEDRHFPQKYKKSTKRKFPVYFVQAFGGFIIVHNSNQIKLADGTNTSFDSSNPDIRYKNGGETESLIKNSKRGNTPARDLNNYNDVMDLQADGMVGAETGLYAEGGRVNELVEYITIGNQSSNPFNDIEKVRFYNFNDFKDFINGLYNNTGATNKRQIYLCVNNDESFSEANISVSQGKNTNKNFNPFTGSFDAFFKNINDKIVARKYDWSFWSGVKTSKATSSQTNVPTNKILTIEELRNKKLWIGDDIPLLNKVIDKLKSMGVPYDAVHSSKNPTNNILIETYLSDFVVWKQDKSGFDKLKKEEIFPSDLGINTSNVSSSTQNAPTTSNSSGKFSNEEIDLFNQIDIIVKANGFKSVDILEWKTTSSKTKDFYVEGKFTGEIFKLRSYITSLGVPDDDAKRKGDSIALIKDYLEYKKNNPNATTTSNQTSTQNAPFDLNYKWIFVGGDIELAKRVVERAIELGKTDFSAIKRKINNNDKISVIWFNDKYIGWGDNNFSKDNPDYEEIYESDLFPIAPTQTTSSQTSTQNAPVNEDWVKKFTADLDKLVFGQSDSELEKAITLDVIENAPQISKDQRDLNNLKKLLPSFQAKKYAIERAKILKEIKKLDNKLTYEGFIKPNEAMSSESNLFTPQGLLDYYYTQATQNPTAELEPACELPTPNGEKSKLPLSAYLNVRTPQFKKWFGDWEKAYETGNYVNCSKMIDPDTKEPKIYFHGVRKFVPNFGQFSNMGQGVVRPYGTFEPPTFPASYFAGEEDYAKFYGGIAENMPTPSPDYKPFIYKVFLSVKNPISLLPLDFMLSYKDFMDYVFVAYGVKVTPNQELLKILGNDIKKKNPMWIYVRRDIGFIEMLKDYGYDALFQIGDIPTFLPNGEVEPDRTKHLQEVEYLTFYPNQVKSATVKKSFYFDFFNDIRFKNGGYVRI